VRKWFPTSKLTQLTHLRILLNKNRYAFSFARNFGNFFEKKPSTKHLFCISFTFSIQHYDEPKICKSETTDSVLQCFNLQLFVATIPSASMQEIKIIYICYLFVYDYKKPSVHFRLHVMFLILICFLYHKNCK